uniref:GPI ethanolamine phosphate transferase 1 n=1 Tax=Heterorhabditis bacteriophora TaxID=37862 RepID=A0A1I7WPE0_HETBA
MSYLISVGVVIHLILVYSMFDIYYISPVVTGIPGHEIAKNDAPAKRIVIISAGSGISGISRSHVPTESRPGHVAIFAGFTEDVSAVASGWKHNPVQFDSVFNRSKESWLWGSPDIVSLFDDQPHIHSFSYFAEYEDFGSNEAFKLDEWVFNSVEHFFMIAKNNVSLIASLKSDKIIFFLHLLGIDTNGHGNKPYSKQYLDNLRGGARRTISQVDITPLLSCLLGVPIPVNSIGVLPIHILDVFPKYLFRSSFANFLQLLALRNEKAKRLWFRDYKAFGDHALNVFLMFPSIVLRSMFHSYIIYNLLSRFASAASLFVENAASLKHAIFYYHRYDQPFLGAAVSMSFIGWICLLWCYLTNNLKRNSICKCILLFVFILVFMDRRFLSVIFILLMLAPNLYDSPKATEWAHMWRMCCFFLVPFPFLATVGRNEIPLLCVLSPTIMGCVLIRVTRYPYLTKRSKSLKRLAYLQFANACLIFISNFILERPSSIIRFISWCSLPFSFVLPLSAPPIIMDKMIWFICSLFLPYSLLSIAYESLFMLCFIPLLFIFGRIESGHLTDVEFTQLSSDKLIDAKSIVVLFLIFLAPLGQITLTEIRRAIIYISFVLTTLFGTGNFASLNSFNPSTLSRFISVFSPFTMATLLLIKLLIPLFMTSLMLASILKFDREAIHRISCLVLIITDLMAMVCFRFKIIKMLLYNSFIKAISNKCFFHQLKDTGSWLDIGLSISQYLVAMSMSVALLLLLLISSRLMTISFSLFQNKIKE